MKRVVVAVLLLGAPVALLLGCGSGEQGSSRPIAPGGKFAGKYTLAEDQSLPAAFTASVLAHDFGKDAEAAGSASAGERYRELNRRAAGLYPRDGAPRVLDLHLRDSFIELDGQYWYTFDVVIGSPPTRLRGVWAGLADGSRDQRPAGLMLCDLDERASVGRLFCVAAPLRRGGREALVLLPVRRGPVAAPVVVERVE